MRCARGLREKYRANGIAALAINHCVHFSALWVEIEQLTAVDATDGGAAKRFSLSGVWRQTNAESASKVSAYIIRNQLALYSNFTYFLDDPVNGDQFAQPDRRVTSGINASHTWHTHPNDITSDWILGAQLQNDNIFNGLLSTCAPTVQSEVNAAGCVCQVWLALMPLVTRRSGCANWSPLTGSSRK